MTRVDGGGLPAGTQLNGIYEIVKRIGKGGMGEVYAAREIHSGNPMAIKTILPEFSRDQMVLDLFRREASVLNKLHHEAIVGYSVFSVDPQLQRPYLAMEFAYGPSLRERLRRGRALDNDEFDHLRKRIAGGLNVAHKAGIVHRDISPDNIVLVDDNVERAKIIDFGIAKAAGEEKTILGDQFAGKVSYASPEQIGLGKGKIDGKTDVYALGIVFAEALTAQSLNMGGSQVEGVEKRKRVPDLSHVPAYWRPLVASMLHPNPEKRPTMSEVAAWDPETGRKPGNGGGGGVLRALGLVIVAIGAVAAILALLWIFLAGQTRLVPPSPEQIAAASGQVGQVYSWTSPAFEFSGDLAELQLDPAGPLPAGLKLTATRDGTVTLAGTPVEAGEAVVDIVATAPDGTTARQRIAVAIAPRPNEAPEVADAPGAAVELTVGRNATVPLGRFTDDDDPGLLHVEIAGRLPAGTAITVEADGSVGLGGTPIEDGTFPFEVVATDGEGASARFPVTVTITRPGIDLQDPARVFIAQANRARCFFTRILELGRGSARLEAFASEADPIHALDRDFKASVGYEAQIRGRQITPQQCRMIDALSLLEFSMVEHDSGLRMGNDRPASGELVKGIVAKGADALLFVINAQGLAQELQVQSAIVGQDLEFQTRLNGRGPHLIVAAIPAAPGALAGATTFQDIARPSMRGRVKLAIAYLSVR